MQERRVTIEGAAFEVTAPFMVLATQNPIEQDGTYPLPEAELDRFMMKVLIDYPSEAHERTMVDRVTTGRVADLLNVDDLAQILDGTDIVALQGLVSRIAVDGEVMSYAVRLARATRETIGLQRGAGPRASIALVRIARANALVDGRDFVLPDDIKNVALPVLRHRVQLSPELEIEGVSADSVISGLLETVPAPRQ
jgi:MoxR-like ATPase